MFFSCGQNETNNEKTSKLSQEEVIKIAREAYVYALPLVIMDLTKKQSTNFYPGNRIYAPVNVFNHSSQFPDASFRSVVRPNADTYYSTAMLDLTDEPVVLSLPDTKGRYYMMPMLDAYTNVFASPGTRTTGDKAGDYLITGPQWKGVVPEGMKEIKAPTNLVWIIGRTQVNNKEDGRRVVVPLQNKYELIPMSKWGKAYKIPTHGIEDTTIPKGDPNSVVVKMSIEDYFTHVNTLLYLDPPPAADNEALERFASIGVGPGLKFNIMSFDDSTKSLLRNIPKEVFAGFKMEISKPKQDLINGWTVHKGLGAYGTDYAKRAFVSYMGLGANLSEDAIYPGCAVDADGNALNGANNYVLHFDKGKTPPANAFWSLTMYSEDGYFVDNSINRYTLGDRSKLKTNADGSVDIYIQHTAPSKDKMENWLPSPKENFNLLLRVYWPKEEMISGKWEAPAVKKAE